MLAASAPARADEVLVSAAASLTNALQAVGRAYTRAHPSTTVRFNFASSGALQQQIEQGAPVDVFASAGGKEMDALQRAGYLAPDTRAAFAGNRLVLIVPVRRAAPQPPVRGWEDLRRPAARRVALANPASVPAGRYARETLEHRGLWTAVQGKAVLGENVRQTLAYVADGDVDAGIVFATDAAQEQQNVRIAAVAAPQDHEPIVYPVAVVRRAPNPRSARQFTMFLQSRAAADILAGFGFTLPARVRAAAVPTPRAAHAAAIRR